jgi:hypothetical protein
MAHSFTCQTCNQDAVVSQNSSMLLILSALYVNGDRNKPAITVTDKTYGRINHFKPLHSVVELLMMAPNERALAVEFNKKHKIPPIWLLNIPLTIRGRSFVTLMIVLDLGLLKMDAQIGNDYYSIACDIYKPFFIICILAQLEVK